MNSNFLHSGEMTLGPLKSSSPICPSFKDCPVLVSTILACMLGRRKPEEELLQGSVMLSQKENPDSLYYFFFFFFSKIFFF